jgi:phosphoglycolate phosphatase
MDITYRAYPINAVLLDLDGTLLHTAPEITDGINLMLAGLGLPPLSEAQVTPLIGKGSRMLVERVFALLDIQTSPGARLHALHAYDQHYAGIVGTRATLYPGVLGALEELRCMHGLKLAVVTNTTHRIATRLLNQFNLSPLIDLVVGGDTLEMGESQPQRLLHACDCLGVVVSEAIYVCDSIHGVEAANGAGMPVCCVPDGYNEGHPGASLRRAGLIESIAEVPDLIRGRPGLQRNSLPLPTQERMAQC